ncbi:MAG: hypothetical protein AAF530_14880 [Pseudomonadota bacterium]
MVEILEGLYGPAAQSDPYFLLLKDFWVLMPWWYPYLWPSIIGAVILYRLLQKWRRRRAAKRGIARVHSRTQRLLGEGEAKMASQRLARRPANDHVHGGPLLYGFEN